MVRQRHYRLVRAVLLLAALTNIQVAMPRRWRSAAKSILYSGTATLPEPIAAAVITVTAGNGVSGQNTAGAR